MGSNSVGVSLTQDPIFKTILLAQVGSVRAENTRIQASVCVHVCVYAGVEKGNSDGDTES